MQTRLRPFRPVPFGRYTLLAELAKGGMGEIYLARFDGPQGFEKLCVIKKILPHLAADPDFVARFVNEAKTVVKLTHGSIAQVLDMGLQGGEPYLALEHVDGKDLRKLAARMRDRQLPIPLTVVLYVMSRVLDALAYAHRKRDDDEKEISLVHRDISPQNVLVSYEGEVKVIDFGLAKSSLNQAKTNPSIILGKFLYMSPEQARHAGVDRRSDLYAVGLCLYELIHGKNPFDSVPTGELISQVANPDIPPLLEVEPLCPPAVAQVVARALQADPEERFQTAEEFRGKLLACLLDIDASAGPESVSRFMREAFAAEYQAERRMLAGFRDAPRPRADAETVALSAKEIQNLVAARPERSSGPKPQVTPLLKGRPPGRRDEPDPLTEHDVPIIRAPEFERPREGPEVTLPRAQAEKVGPSELTQPRAPLELERPPSPPEHDTNPRALPPLPDTDPAARQQQRTITGPMDLQVTQPRAVLPPMPSEQTQPRADLPPLPHAKADTEPRVVMGTLLPEEEAAEAQQPDDPALTWRPVTAPPAAGAPPLELGLATQELSPPASLGPGGSPQRIRAGRTGWLVVLGIVAVTLGAAAFFLWDMYRSGAFIADADELAHARPSDAVPVKPRGPPGPASPAKEGAAQANSPSAPDAGGPAHAGAPPPDAGAPAQIAAPAVADAGAATPPGTALAAAAEPDLEPLSNAATQKKAPPRKKPARPNQLARDWVKARGSFELLVRSRPCEAPSMALLCTRYDALRHDVEQADLKDADRLLSRVRAFYDAVEQKRGHK